MKDSIKEIIAKNGKSPDALIPILQEVQETYNYLPEEALKYICEHSSFTPATVMGVATFYKQFRLQPAGQHTVSVCIGTACHVKGAENVFDSIKRFLKISADEDTDKDRLFTVKKVGCLGCCSLAPAVQINNVTYGHVRPSDIQNIIKDFITREHKKEKESAYVSRSRHMQGEIRLGLGSCCIASGSGSVKKIVEDTIKQNALKVKIKEVGCVGMCHQVPLLEVLSANEEARMYAKIKPEDVPHIIQKHFKPAGFVKRLIGKLYNMAAYIQDDYLWEGSERFCIDPKEKHVAAFLGAQTPIATEHRGIINPTDIEEYIERGGFVAKKKALQHTSENLIDTVKRSGLRGRGGAGFLTGDKWAAVAQQKADVKYIICNGDEGDPGAFMDRMLLESYPYRIIEGMLIAAVATGATKGFLYIRAEYPLAVLRVREALKYCREKGVLGEKIAGSSFDIDISVKEGAGAFVCGEETALISSVEGKRGFPYFRPPYPAEKGLWGKPTLINNTETFAQIPFIIDKGHEEFCKLGTPQSKGAKVFALAGKINRGGLIEVPMGISLRKIVEDIGGGVQNNKKLKAIQIGGPSGGCVPASLVDTPIDYFSLEEAGAMMGSGGLVVLDEDDCMVDVAKYFLSFTQSESCGKCTFCRVGTHHMLDIMEKFCAGKATKADLSTLERLAQTVSKGSLCGLGKTAPNPVLSTLKHFREEYHAHINGKCPAGKCKELIIFFITDKCIGCTICAQECPVEAIPFSPHNKHEINTALCVKCNTCEQLCPQNAISIM